MTKTSLADAQRELSFKSRGKRILIVDDSDADAFVLEHALSKMGHPNLEILHAHSLAKALDILEKQEIDVCVSDYHLSAVETALDLLRVARYRGILIPFVSVTGRTDEETLVHELLSAGFDDVLHKDDVRSANIYRVIRNAWLRNQYTSKVESQAGTDDLTGLDNRRNLLRRLKVELARSKRMDFSLSLLYLDLNRFKQLNDTYGHAVGDAALVHLANLLKMAIRESDGVARLGGDEFVIVAPHCSEEMAENLSSKLEAVLELNPLEIDGEEPLVLLISVGTVTCNAKAERKSPEALLELADQAMYEVKHARA